MRLTSLNLQNFRNLRELNLNFTPGITVLYGDNGQGKTNLLEAVSLLATATSLRADNDRELISWEAAHEEVIPFVRVRGTVVRLNGPAQVEVVVQLTTASSDKSSLLQKRTRLNGAPRRPSDLVGEVKAVLFSPQDIDLVYGPPAIRRRYLNLILSQAARPLLRELQRYGRVLTQRNSLLRAVRDGKANAEELEFWDNELAESGSTITRARTDAMASLERWAGDTYKVLTGGRESLGLEYRPSVAAGPGADLEEVFRRALVVARGREVFLGASLVGPHRDNFVFAVDGRDLGTYGSRGQQRTAALALKLAEARYLAQAAGEPPLLLLDDVFSELDGHRKGWLLSLINEWEQAILTTVEPDRLDRLLISRATLLEVAGGAVRAGRLNG